MTFTAEQVLAGGWIAAIYKAIRYYDVDDPALDHFEATIISGKTADFLSSIRALGNVDRQKYERNDQTQHRQRYSGRRIFLFHA